VLEQSHYYPYGLTVSGEPASSVNEQPIKLTTKELETSFNLNMYDFNDRKFVMQRGQWTSIDRKAEAMRRWSPYTYCFANPVSFIDPDGMSPTIFINENAPTSDIQAQGNAQSAANQLDEGSSLNIKRNPFTGQISATGTATTAADQRLLQAINDPTIKVNITAEETQKVLGGGFMGNTVNQGTSPGPEDNTVNAHQLVNPRVLKEIDGYYSTPGLGMLHEALEAYDGASNSQQSGISAITSNLSRGTAVSDYDAAHASATNVGAGQGGGTYFSYYNADGVEVENKSDATEARYFISDGVKPPKVIQINKFGSK